MNNPEIIVNLWYVMDERGLIYSLRARCYVGEGTMADKLKLLRRFARTDYLIAQPSPIPERFHTTMSDDERQRKLPLVRRMQLRRLAAFTNFSKKHFANSTSRYRHEPC
jgi:hypothetical protein